MWICALGFILRLISNGLALDCYCTCANLYYYYYYYVTVHEDNFGAISNRHMQGFVYASKS